MYFYDFIFTFNAKVIYQAHQSKRKILAFFVQPNLAPFGLVKVKNVVKQAKCVAWYLFLDWTITLCLNILAIQLQSEFVDKWPGFILNFFERPHLDVKTALLRVCCYPLIMLRITLSF